jgi:hypothetical protein
MHAASAHRSTGGDERLSGDLPTKGSLSLPLRVGPLKEGGVYLAHVEQAEEKVERVIHSSIVTPLEVTTIAN